jgi:hypothetical protein
MSIAELADFICANVNDFGIDPIDTTQLVIELTSEKAVIDKQTYGFAALIPQKSLPAAKLLYFVWIAPKHRGQRIGRQYVRRLIREHQGDYVVVAVCYGKQRSKFFQKCGGQVVKWDRQTGRREIELGRCRDEKTAFKFRR